MDRGMVTQLACAFVGVSLTLEQQLQEACKGGPAPAYMETR